MPTEREREYYAKGFQDGLLKGEELIDTVTERPRQRDDGTFFGL